MGAAKHRQSRRKTVAVDGEDPASSLGFYSHQKTSLGAILVSILCRCDCRCQVLNYFGGKMD